MEKGQTNNPNGRPKGTPNKSTRELRDAIQKLVEKNLSQIAKDLKALPPKERLEILVKLLAYVTPKMQAIEADMRTREVIEMDAKEYAEAHRQLTPKEAAEFIRKLQEEY